jgi:hypothetical protein
MTASNAIALVAEQFSFDKQGSLCYNSAASEQGAVSLKEAALTKHEC